ncbi:MAG: O-antigen/teichoic acid export membrane protein, partial [Planctomycetota bacterium]
MAAGQLVLVPIFLRAWGEARYGEWLTLSAMAAQIALVDFGVQTYVVNRLNQNYARGEIDQYNRVLHSALYWSLALAAVAFVIAA